VRVRVRGWREEQGWMGGSSLWVHHSGQRQGRHLRGAWEGDGGLLVKGVSACCEAAEFTVCRHGSLARAPRSCPLLIIAFEIPDFAN
jgi:hypothetical protein